MTPKRFLPRLFAFLLPGLLCACQSRQALDTHMKDIAGTYRLISVSDTRNSYLETISEAERNAILPARLFQVEETGSWVFEYSLVTQASKGYLTCHRIMQEFVWEQSFGCYLFCRLTSEDLKGTGLEPEDIRVEFKSGSIVVTNIHTNLVCEWHHI